MQSSRDLDGAAGSRPGARAMTVEDLLLTVRVSDPRLSPDGRTVAYVRTTTDLAANTRNAEIWVVPADGSGPPRGIIVGEKAGDTPRWSPDGRHLAFISKRDGDAQVFLADADGGNVRKLTTVSGGVQAPMVWSPDGDRVAFVADVFPDCADDAANRARREAIEKDPVKVRVLDRLLYRHWDEWRENTRHHVFITNIDGGSARDLTPGDFDAPTFQLEEDAIAFTPDGAALAFVSNRDGIDVEAWTTTNDVWLVPVTGGEATKVTTNRAADARPVFTRDGKLMLVMSQRRPGFEADRRYLDVYDRATGAKRTVFETPDLSITNFWLASDDREILFVATANGTDNLYRVPLAGGTPVLVERGGAISALSVGANTVVYLRSSMTAPAELWSASLAHVLGAAGNDAPRQLTHENAAWLGEAEVRVPVSKTTAGAGGTPVQYWLLTPPGFDPSRKYPVVFLIHGGPQGDWGDSWSHRWNPALWAAQGWVVVAPNPRGSTGFGQKFVDEISRDWGGKVMEDLDAVFAAVRSLPYVDAERQGIAGASYGGYAVNWIIGHTTVFKAAVSHDGVFNMESMMLTTDELWFSEWESGGAVTSEAARADSARWSPHRFAGAMRTPTLVITNELDFRVPVDQGLQLFTALRRNGVQARALVFPDEGHWVLKPLNSRRWHEDVFAWMTRCIGP